MMRKLFAGSGWRPSEQGYANAEVARFRLGTMYKDSVLAYIWFTIAGTNGNERAKDLRDDLERNMARAEISRATELARACRASDYQDCEP